MTGSPASPPPRVLSDTIQNPIATPARDLLPRLSNHKHQDSSLPPQLRALVKTLFSPQQDALSLGTTTMHRHMNSQALRSSLQAW